MKVKLSRTVLILIVTKVKILVVIDVDDVAVVHDAAADDDDACIAGSAELFRR